MYLSWRCRSILDNRMGWAVDCNESGSVVLVNWDSGGRSWVSYDTLEDLEEEELEVACNI